MLVIAIKPAFHDGRRVRVGDKLDFKGEKLPSWAKEDTPEVRAEIASEKYAEATKAREAVVAAAGPKRKGPGAKVVFTENGDTF